MKQQKPESETKLDLLSRDQTMESELRQKMLEEPPRSYMAELRALHPEQADAIEAAQRERQRRYQERQRMLLDSLSVEADNDENE